MKHVVVENKGAVCFSALGKPSRACLPPAIHGSQGKAGLQEGRWSADDEHDDNDDDVDSSNVVDDDDVDDDDENVKVDDDDDEVTMTVTKRMVNVRLTT